MALDRRAVRPNPRGQVGDLEACLLQRARGLDLPSGRDEGERAAPIDPYPWDGVTNLRLFSRLAESVVVGVY